MIVRGAKGEWATLLLLLVMPTASCLVPQPHVLHEPEVQQALLALRWEAALLRKPAIMAFISKKY
jgi:hypothetical protein